MYTYRRGMQLYIPLHKGMRAEIDYVFMIRACPELGV